MAQRTVVRLTDDLDGREIPEGKGETVLFELDGSAYEIDLSNRNAAALRKALEQYMSAGRRVRRPRGGGDRRQSLHNPRAARAATASRNPYAQKVREWARANGYELNDRGRIPSGILQAYEASRQAGP